MTNTSKSDILFLMKLHSNPAVRGQGFRPLQGNASAFDYSIQSADDDDDSMSDINGNPGDMGEDED